MDAVFRENDNMMSCENGDHVSDAQDDAIDIETEDYPKNSSFCSDEKKNNNDCSFGFNFYSMLSKSEEDIDDELATTDAEAEPEDDYYLSTCDDVSLSPNKESTTLRSSVSNNSFNEESSQDERECEIVSRSLSNRLRHSSSCCPITPPRRNTRKVENEDRIAESIGNNIETKNRLHSSVSFNLNDLTKRSSSCSVETRHTLPRSSTFSIPYVPVIAPNLGNETEIEHIPSELNHSHNRNDTVIPFASTVRTNRRTRPREGLAASFHLDTLYGNPSYPCISPQTLVNAFNYDNYYTHKFIFDSRFGYEYQHGHIKGAVNLTGPVDEIFETIMKMFFSPPPKEQQTKVLIVFHCEHSKKRGPENFKLFQAIESCYRYAGIANTDIDSPPKLFPEVYLLFGGYKWFYEVFKDQFCEPIGYIEMEDPLFVEERKEAETKCKDNKVIGSQLVANLKKEVLRNQLTSVPKVTFTHYSLNSNPSSEYNDSNLTNSPISNNHQLVIKNREKSNSTNTETKRDRKCKVSRRRSPRSTIFQSLSPLSPPQCPAGRPLMRNKTEPSLQYSRTRYSRHSVNCCSYESENYQGTTNLPQGLAVPRPKMRQSNRDNSQTPKLRNESIEQTQSAPQLNVSYKYAQQLHPF